MSTIKKVEFMMQIVGLTDRITGEYFHRPRAQGLILLFFIRVVVFAEEGGDAANMLVIALPGFDMLLIAGTFCQRRSRSPP